MITRSCLDKAAEVELPMVHGSVIPITVYVQDGFSPREIDPSSNDPRFLGIFEWK